MKLDSDFVVNGKSTYSEEGGEGVEDPTEELTEDEAWVSDSGPRQAEDGIHHEVWVVWVQRHALWTHKCPCNLSEVDGACAAWASVEVISLVYR